MPARSRLDRAAEYRRQAIAASALAQSSQLIGVREKHEHAAARWTALALIDEEPPHRRATLSAAPRR